MNNVVDDIARTFGVERNGVFTYEHFSQMMKRYK